MGTSAGFTLGELAATLGAKLEGDPDRRVTGVAPLETAGPEQISFLIDARYRPAAEASRAGALLVADSMSGLPAPLLRSSSPQQALIALLTLFHPVAPPPAGIDSSAMVARDARIDASASIGALAVIGGDGFGYVFDGGGHRKIPQVGIVVIEDDVDIGANTTIDRAMLGRTIIRRGTKIDNLVQVGHNVEIGEHSIIVAQVGISGSCRLGRGVIAAGQVGFADHLTIGDGAVLGAQAGVSEDVPAGERRLGAPALPILQMKRIFAAQKQLPEMSRRLRAAERRLAELETRLGIAAPDAGEDRSTDDRA